MSVRTRIHGGLTRVAKVFGPGTPESFRQGEEAAQMTPASPFSPGTPIGPYDGYDRMPRAHDFTTGNPGAWDRIQTSRAVLRAEGARLTGNMCVVSSNYASMLPLCEIAQKFGFENLHFDIVRPRDAGERTDEHLRAMMNRYSELAPQFEALSREVDARLGPGFDLNFGNMP